MVGRRKAEHHAPGAGVWREAEEVWSDARAFYVDCSADGLGNALARAGLPLGSDDVLGLWRAAGRRGDCSLASLDQFFRLPPTKEKPPKVPTCVREEAPFACGGDPRNLWQPRRPPSRTSGVWRADEETEGAFDGWNHLEMVEKRPASKGDFAVCPPSPKRKSETHFLEGKVVPPFWTADRRLHQLQVGVGTTRRSGTSTEVSGSRRGSRFSAVRLSRVLAVIAWRRGWVRGRPN